MLVKGAPGVNELCHCPITWRYRWIILVVKVTDLLWGESNGDQWIPLTKFSGELWYFLWSEKTVEQTIDTPGIWDTIALMLNHIDFDLWFITYCLSRGDNPWCGCSQWEKALHSNASFHWPSPYHYCPMPPIWWWRKLTADFNNTFVDHSSPRQE